MPRKISTRSIASISLCKYRTLMPMLAQIIGQFLRGPLGQGGHQHPLLYLHPFARFLDQIVDLALQRLDA